jgi:23S rRNA (guanosine2251-2'-O)-methyltransferase
MQKLSMDALNRKSVEEFQRSEKHPIVVVLENIRSMHNVGSVFRSADAFLIESVCLTGYTPCPPHRDIHKTALGATETVAWNYFQRSSEAIQLLKSEGYTIYAAEQTNESIPVQQLLFSEGKKVAIIFGNEASGVEEETLKICDGAVEIPQFGMKHSLNVSVAAGIVLWECVRKMHLNTN